MMHPDSIAAALSARRRRPEDILRHIADGDDLIVGAANGEPKTVIDAIEALLEETYSRKPSICHRRE